MDRREFIKAAGGAILGSLLFNRESNAVIGNTIIIGRSKVIIGYRSLVGTQIDRVLRDIAWMDNRFESIPLGGDNLVVTDKTKLVPYMEGRLSGLLIDYANATILGLTPSIAGLVNDPYYGEIYCGMDGNGNYAFKIDSSKLAYESVGWTTDKQEAIMVDTHGFNSVAAEAIKTSNIHTLSLVMACMDLESKANAALHLAQNGINCYAPCDRFAGYLVGYNAPGTIICSAPIRKIPQKRAAVIGNQPIKMNVNEKIIVQTWNVEDGSRYCDAPDRYMQGVANYLKINLNTTTVNAGIGETGKIIDAAKYYGAKVISVRIYNEDDRLPVDMWLSSDINNRAILLHSAAYDSGYRMFFDHPKQTTFGDLKPKIA